MKKKRSGQNGTKSRKQTIENIKILVKQANQEKKKDGEISNKTARKLQKELKRIDDDNLISENKQADKGDVITLKGSSGGWKDLGYKGWKYRVDLPEHGGDSKPHVHVKGKSGKKLLKVQKMLMEHLVMAKHQTIKKSLKKFEIRLAILQNIKNKKKD